MADKCCYSNDGLTFRYVPEDYVAQDGEALFSDKATPKQLTKAFPNNAKAASDEFVKRQIIALELSMTPRRIREAIAGTDNGWLAGLNTQIANLRNQL